jgi:hypothetical protein
MKELEPKILACSFSFARGFLKNMLDLDISVFFACEHNSCIYLSPVTRRHKLPSVRFRSASFEIHIVVPSCNLLFLMAAAGKPLAIAWSADTIKFEIVSGYF